MQLFRERIDPNPSSVRNSAVTFTKICSDSGGPAAGAGGYYYPQGRHSAPTLDTGRWSKFRAGRSSGRSFSRQIENLSTKALPAGSRLISTAPAQAQPFVYRVHDRS